VQTITSVVLAAGLVFQLPILVYFLSKVGLVTPDFLKKYRRHSLVLIVTLSAIITPPDVFSQVLVALPLMVLYEIGIAISKRIMKQQDAEELAREESYKSKKKRPAKDPEAEKKDTVREPEAEKAEEPETKEEVSTKKPWKRPASKPDPDEKKERDEEDSDAEDDKTD
jgi:hypothetical protein